MLENLSYNQFWAIFYNLSILILVGVFIWLFYPQRKYYLKKLEQKREETDKK
ncbi:MAG: hypothetical protein ACLFPL_05505 [Candidatus Nanoarchaeia archaeon]